MGKDRKAISTETWRRKTRKRVASTGNSKCKGPEGEAHLVCLGNVEEARVPGIEMLRGTVGRDEGRGVMGQVVQGLVALGSTLTQEGGSHGGF